MATYAIGDVQGCYRELLLLLEKIHFNEKKDELWFAGDLINRGEDSLGVLRFIKNLGPHHISVLGNHDLYFLMVSYGCRDPRSEDTFQDILQAPDREELTNWLRHQKLLHYDPRLNFVLVHAGISPQWTLEQAIQYAQEIEQMLQGKQYLELLQNAYGNEPIGWSDTTSPWDRARLIMNVFLRMRFCHANGDLELMEKGNLSTPHPTQQLYPWFRVPTRIPIQPNIVFGHWAALNGVTNMPNIFGVDTGCAWGHQLTALRLEDLQRFSVDKQTLSNS
jgi:bis(5'-nucleosyl)-tetraphosphatase (symmetrical)